MKSMKGFTPEVRGIVAFAKTLKDELGHSLAGHEHLLFAFASGAGGDTIRIAFESTGLTADAIRSAVEYIDGPRRTIQADQDPDDFVHQEQAPKVPFVDGLLALVAQQRFVGLTPAADSMFKLALAEAETDEVQASDVLRTFLREVENSDYDRRVLLVIDQAVPGLTVDDIKSAMVNALTGRLAMVNALIDASKYGKVIIVDMTTISEPLRKIVELKHERWALIHLIHRLRLDAVRV